MARKAFLTITIAAVCALIFPAQASYGHERETPDDVLKRIGVDEKPGGQVPPGLLFTDSAGNRVRLGDFFGGGPVLLTLNYYTCPMLCPLILRNLLAAADRMGGISISRDYRIVTVSIDPDDRPESARDRAGEMHAMMKGVKEPASRWPFLFGEREEIDRLAQAVGFRYAKVGKEFAHPNVVVVLTSDGRISRYLYGIEQEPRDLKLALIEAAGGRIGDSSAFNRALLFCFHYDPVQRKYALYARNIMKAGGVLTLVFLGGIYFAIMKRRKPEQLS
ncbi:MAG: SCO family protein [Deltaproteobacteria bacterium]|nr:SCO family protein [Deltaproteobacteria bacterium]